MPWKQHVDWRWDCGTRQRSRSQTDDNGDRPIPIFCTKPFDGLDRVWAASIIVFSFVCHFVRRRNGEQLGLKGEALSFAPLRFVCFQWVFGNPEHHPSNWINFPSPVYTRRGEWFDSFDWTTVRWRKPVNPPVVFTKHRLHYTWLSLPSRLHSKIGHVETTHGVHRDVVFALFYFNDMQQSCYCCQADWKNIWGVPIVVEI